MKHLKSLLLIALTLPILFLVSCGEDEPENGLVNFEQTAYDLDVSNLTPVEVDLSIDPAAPMASSISVNFTGAEAGTVFTTTPALSGSTVQIPVAEGDVSVSFTVTFDAANLPAGDIVLEMTLASPGEGLGTGITTSSQINLANVELTAIPYSEGFGDACGDPFPPADGGFIIENPLTNSAGDGGANTGSWRCNTFGMISGAGAIGNAFVGGSADNSTSETWLVSPVIGPVTSTTSLSFAGDLRFNDIQAGFEWYDILISTDYTGLNLETANWTRLTDAYDALAGNDVGADDIEVYGGIDLSAFEGKAVAIAFIYRCSKPSNCAAMRVDAFEITN